MKNVQSFHESIFQYARLNENQIKQILNPEEIQPFPHLKEMQSIIKRIDLAKQNREKVIVVGDYDADGICATTILVDALEKYGLTVGYYIPNRLKEGYGLNTDIIQLAIKKGYQLLITVDNGVAAKEAIKSAQQKIDIIVTDHHLIAEDIEFQYLLHPSIMEKRYQTMCGSGVALQLARHLTQDVSYYYVLAMIATIADMMEVFDENRVIIKHGLKLLNQYQYPTIAALLDKPISYINEMDIAFQVVPKINAIGRLADEANPNNLIKYFRLHDVTSIQQMAKQIKEINQKRKALTKEYDLNKLIHVGVFDVYIDESLHEGITGLIAGQILQKTERPTMVLAKKDDTYKGSIRCLENFNIYEFLQPLASYTNSFGGHAQAGGISIGIDQFPLFLDAIEVQSETMALTALAKKEYIDLDVNDLSISLVESLDALRPFGMGFTTPIFEVKQFKVEAYQVLQNQYLKWSSTIGKEEIEALYFKQKYTYEDFKEKKEMSFKGSLSINQFRMKKKMNIIIEEI